MIDEIKKCYDFLGLSYDATLEQLDERERELTNRYMNNGTNHNQDIAFVKIARDKVYNYIVNEKSNTTGFNTKWGDIGTMLFILAMLVVSTVACLLALVL